MSALTPTKDGRVRYTLNPEVDPYEAPLLIPGQTPHVCPTGHAMDEGYSLCPCCGAYRASNAVVDHGPDRRRWRRPR